MRLFYTTPDFVYKGRICADLPFLCNDDMTFMPVANDYLLWVCLENASTASPATWKSYAETLFDYFSWLSTNGFAWDALPIKGPQGEEISNLAMYRNWSMDLIHPSSGKPRVAPSTLRRRMTQIMAFYRWHYSEKGYRHYPGRPHCRVFPGPEYRKNRSPSCIWISAGR